MSGTDEDEVKHVNVLLVEDDDLDARIVRRTFDKHSPLNLKFELTHCATLQSAIDAMEARSFDVVLVDLNLPDSSGKATVDRILGTAPNMVVIALTGMADDRLAVEAVRAGAADYLNKNSVEANGLVRAIRYAMERQRAKVRLAATIAAKQEAEALAALADDFRDARDRAEAANQAKTEFLANISHELRTPVHGMLSFARFGVRRIDNVPKEKLLSYFQQIESSGEVLLSLLNDLLDLSKYQAGGFQFEFASTDVVERVRIQLNGFAAESAKNEIDVKLVMSDNAPEHAVQADAGRLDQLFRNLISNAIKFSPKQSTIEIAISQNENATVIQILDQGPGIPEDEIESIFEKFVQSSTTKTAAGGTGLGLAICREIVEAHDGAIHATNREDGGCQFTVSLPIKHETRLSTPVSIHDHSSSGSTLKTHFDSPTLSNTGITG